jgi:hypothetical protein
MLTNNEIYNDILLTISTITELLILYYVYIEARAIRKDVKEIHDATTGTVYDQTDDLPVGSRVQVIQPEPSLPRERWGYGQEIYVIREVDKVTKTATATPVLPPLHGSIPTVKGPMRGPLSPFLRVSIPS